MVSRSWLNVFCYLNIDDIELEDFDSENKLVKEISLRLEPAMLVITVVAYGPAAKQIQESGDQLK